MPSVKAIQAARELYKAFSYYGADSFIQEHYAYDSISDNEVDPRDTNANCWCAVGMLSKIYNVDLTENILASAYDNMTMALSLEIFDRTDYYLTTFNDTHTYEELMNLLKDIGQCTLN